MAKIHIDDPHRLKKAMDGLREKVRARFEESILDAIYGRPIGVTDGAATTNCVPAKPVSSEDIIEGMQGMAGAFRSSPLFDVFRGADFRMKAEPPRFSASRYPLYECIFPSALTKIYVDPIRGYDDFPTLRAEMSLPDSPEFRRAWRLYNLKPRSGRRLKRCKRLFLRLITQAQAS